MRLPTITINSDTKITLRRMLPVPGEILVQPGQKVEALTVVARAQMPSRYRVIDVARQLGRGQPDMSQVMKVEAGQQVTANQVIAAIKGGLPFLQRSVRAPAAGHIATVGPGWVLLETERTTVEVQAFINGRVNRVISNRGVIIDTHGAIIEAACGFGGEAHGRLKRLVNSPFEELDAEAIDENASESIILGGRTVYEEALRAAEKWHVRGIIVGSVDASLMKLDPPVKVRVVATAGFGDLPMSPHTFSMLTSLSRREVSIRGQTPILARTPTDQLAEDRPIILAATSIETSSSYATQEKEEATEVTEGSRVRVTRGTLLGTTGTIQSIPLEPEATSAGIIVPGAQVQFNDGVRYIPWANLERVA